jgi:hypothetical protein
MMPDAKETVPVKIIFGFQVTHVADADGELVTTTYEAGQEADLDAEIAREEEHRNRVRIIRPEPAPESAVPEAEVRDAAEKAAVETAVEEVPPSAPAEP